MRTKFAIIIFVLTAIVLPLPAAADGLRSFLEHHKERSSVGNLVGLTVGSTAGQQERRAATAAAERKLVLAAPPHCLHGSSSLCY